MYFLQITVFIFNTCFIVTILRTYVGVLIYIDIDIKIYISINLEGVVNLKTYLQNNCRGHVTCMRAHKIYQYFPVWSLCIKLASWIKQLSVPFSKQEVTAGYQIPISRWMICSHSGACKIYSRVCIWLQLRTLVMSFISTQLSANMSLPRRKAADLIDRWRGFYWKNDNKVNVFSLLYCYQPLYPNTIYFFIILLFTTPF